MPACVAHAAVPRLYARMRARRSPSLLCLSFCRHPPFARPTIPPLSRSSNDGIRQIHEDVARPPPDITESFRARRRALSEERGEAGVAGWKKQEEV